MYLWITVKNRQNLFAVHPAQPSSARTRKRPVSTLGLTRTTHLVTSLLHSLHNSMLNLRGGNHEYNFHDKCLLDLVAGGKFYCLMRPMLTCCEMLVQT